METQRRKCLKNKKTRRQRNEKDMLSLFSWVAPFPFLIYSHEAKKRKGRPQRQWEHKYSAMHFGFINWRFSSSQKYVSQESKHAVLEMKRELCELTVRRLFRKHLTLLEEKNGECVNSHVWICVCTCVWIHVCVFMYSLACVCTSVLCRHACVYAYVWLWECVYST